MIAAYYYINFTTIELFNLSLNPRPAGDHLKDNILMSLAARLPNKLTGSMATLRSIRCPRTAWTRFELTGFAPDQMHCCRLDALVVLSSEQQLIMTQSCISMGSPTSDKDSDYDPLADLHHEDPERDSTPTAAAARTPLDWISATQRG
ncbi:conserved hypothetical protein [Culex quinquefasciatus]|uniref:Uncharacterized protein n=1 Tax=Culex quinquefasciatus TaxID=7176 RepID=B0XLS8_CULQU|nr:conserved hypothetical protein [Culex quinquefasciatus]|eukprot:XP_001870599.1 conserved hypothetical protein [Culex quinquefasciatus]